MTCYDPRSDKVYGVSKNSLAYWHEKEHQQIFRAGITSEKDVLITFILLFSLVCLTFEQNVLARWLRVQNHHKYCNKCWKIRQTIKNEN